MTGVIAYLACVIGTTAVLCCHHGQGTPPGTRLLRHRPAWALNRNRARRTARRTRQDPT